MRNDSILLTLVISTIVLVLTFSNLACHEAEQSMISKKGVNYISDGYQLEDKIYKIIREDIDKYSPSDMYILEEENSVNYSNEEVHYFLEAIKQEDGWGMLALSKCEGPSITLKNSNKANFIDIEFIHFNPPSLNENEIGAIFIFRGDDNKQSCTFAIEGGNGVGFIKEDEKIQRFYLKNDTRIETTVDPDKLKLYYEFAKEIQRKFQ